ncbi:hypothetical protein PICMEDRAFT_18561 [Pichia membranifaciens NRRL Y-2026]|uniref:NADH:flavin oxidoreductase/NADH oxidase N-terminal domain-containing protein n=1 Tax=Pichia membranifaciens NRRL Y-2026 TaxID=763406 RepID=A0A1E3NDA2_9ASCO|nr:hypothetical protein PICMEDRAFT_18561 [Pichia membranifaciens NRRL Y-2026]ODQ44100.1 hypothetical protein PICMEDRAFT_18561 [Pichia membranifaciens NRRL Y-2026]
MTATLANSNLFKPIKVGPVELKNRLVHAPTTRFRNTDEFVATDSMLDYYTERATDNGGLLIVEATFPSPEFGLFERAPMIKTPQQVKAWRRITDSVHAQGSSITLQLWNLGRVADPALLQKHNLPFVGPSAIYLDEASEKAAKEAGNELRAITVPEIKAMVAEYAASAKRSIDEAGFDMIEIHAANMYLPDQFLQETSNTRTDEYGGSLENRARFILETVDACIAAVGAERVAIRFSPYSEFQGSLGAHAETNPIVTWGYVLSELEKRAKHGNRLAYISIVEPRVSGTDEHPDTDPVDFSWPDHIWRGILLRSGGYLSKDAIARLPDVVNSNNHTLIGAGRYFSSNPDLVNRVRNTLEMTQYERSTFYTVGNVGYLDFRESGQPLDHSKDHLVPKPLA